MAEEEEEQAGLFAGCNVAIIQSKELPAINALDFAKHLSEGGADTQIIRNNRNFNVEEYTHIVAANVDFEDFPKYETAAEHMVNVVKPSWITQSLLKNKQVPTRPHTPDTRFIFAGVHITTADIPISDKDAIIGAVVAMGGQESSNLTKMQTHIVALTMDHPKVQQAVEKKLKVKIVLPHWFDDCLKLRRRIDERPYLLPDPEVLRKGPEDEVRLPNSQHIEGATTVTPNYMAPSTDGPNVPLTVFENKTILLSQDLNLSATLRKILENLIKNGGGFITTDVQKANTLICYYRDGTDYVSASRDGKNVGNLSWLYHLITHNEFTSPFRRLLHYPIPRDGIPGFKNLRITLSNYGGEARIYLENLVTASGAQFTKSMKQDNTHLITARDASEKCKAAQEWGIDMINHLWIEESYAKCAIQPLSVKKYTHFPPRTNLGEVIGQTQFDSVALEKMYYSASRAVDASDSPEKKSRTAMSAKDSNAIALTAHTSAEASPVAKSDATITPAKAAPKRLSTPLMARLKEKENDTPSSTSSRGAKDRAVSRLSDLAPDIALYEKEKKRSGSSSIFGGKRAADQLEKEAEEKKNSKKRAQTPDEPEDDESVESEHEAKRQKVTKSVLPEIDMRLLITSYRRWINKPAQEDVDRRQLRSLGILVTQDPYSCTHLAAPAIIRTQKFLTALSSGATLLSTSFIDTCLSKDERPNVNKFLLEDATSEKKWDLKLKDVLARAKANDKKLLDGVAVYCTADIPNGPGTYKAIVEANGGSFYIYKGRGGSVIRPSKAGQTEPTDGDPVYLLTGLKNEEKRLWSKFEQMVRDGRMEPRIVTTEWILNTAMSQQAVWKESFLVPK